MKRHENSKVIISRHPRLARTSAFILAAGLLAGCASSNSSSPSEQQSPKAPVARGSSGLDLFIPTGDTASQYASTARMLRGVKGRLGKVTLAFADISSTGIASAPALNPGLVKLVDSLPKATEVAVAYDGSSPPYTSLNAILDHPNAYVNSVIQTQKAIQVQLPGHKVDGGVDLDDEYPTASQRSSMTAVVRGIASRGLKVTVEMGPGNSQGLDLSAIAKSGATIDVMALDNAIGLSTAQANAAGTTAISDIRSVIQSGVPANQISIEFPAYAQEFPNTTHFGQGYNANSTTEVPDNRLSSLHLTSVIDMHSILSSSGVDRSGLLSWQSPFDIRTTLIDAANLGVDHASLWDGSMATTPIVMAAMTH